MNNPIYGSDKNVDNVILDNQLRNKKRGSSMKEIFGSGNVTESSFGYNTEFGVRAEEKIPNKESKQAIKETKNSYLDAKKTRRNSCHYFGKNVGFYQ